MMRRIWRSIWRSIIIILNKRGEFDLENMDEEQLRAYYAMNGIELPEEFEDGEEDMEGDDDE